MAGGVCSVGLKSEENRRWLLSFPGGNAQAVMLGLSSVSRSAPSPSILPNLFSECARPSPPSRPEEERAKEGLSLSFGASPSRQMVSFKFHMCRPQALARNERAWNGRPACVRPLLSASELPASLSSLKFFFCFLIFLLEVQPRQLPCSRLSQSNH